MRVAVVAPHFPEYAIRYAAGMARLCETLVCVDEGQLADEYAGRAVEPGAARLEAVRFKTPADLARLVRLVLRFRPDVVHLQEAAGPRRAFFNACVLAATRRKATVALTIHDPAPHAGRDEADARRTARIGFWVRRRADVAVLHGAYCARLYRAGSPPPGQLVVESQHGVILEPAEFRPPPGGPPRLYMFGRMEAYKGLDALLGMAEILHAEGAPFALTVAGRGPELDRLEARFKALPEADVRNGFAPPGEVIAAIQDSGCVMLPYLSATQSGVLAAAFAGRRPVIASDVGGLPDVVRDGRDGLLVPPGDPHSLAAAVRRLAGDAALRARLSAGAEDAARGLLDWDRIAAELHRVFSAVGHPLEAAG